MQIRITAEFASYSCLPPPSFVSYAPLSPFFLTQGNTVLRSKRELDRI